MKRRVRDRQRVPEEDPSRWARLLAGANVPPMVARARLDLVKGDVGWLRGALEKPGAWLAEGLGYYVQGPLNTGKSSVAGLLILDAIARCEVCTWLPVRDVPGVRFREGDRNTALHERLYKTDLLVLDDIGAESYRLDGAGGAALEAVIRILYDRDRSVVYTSNVGWRAFVGTYPSGLVSVVRRRTWPVTLTECWPVEPERPE